MFDFWILNLCSTYLCVI
ncbi:hypothetical protein Godav_013327 [Gossypium davidsonii]|uniref:Uncharacterized protein n=2 Tax=Gossypium TaxID=3633 RepID=A0A7J8RFZ2_GOSDV|nr:hypothetical protein [Gossypium davidsonii]MBA0647964.1 hypothetical protein [Gossypium klotzschianum]